MMYGIRVLIQMIVHNTQRHQKSHSVRVYRISVRVYTILFTYFIIFSRLITLVASKLPCLRVFVATTSSDIVRVPHVPLVGAF